MSARTSGGGTPATVALTTAGVAFSLHDYEPDGHGHGYGEQAARALGLDAARIFKTLVTNCQFDRAQLVVAVVPVATQLDLKALAVAVGAKRAVMADPAVAQRSTGYVVGGISPLGQRTALRTVIDDSARGFPTIYVSAGRRGQQVEVAPDDLARVTHGDFAAIGR